MQNFRIHRYTTRTILQLGSFLLLSLNLNGEIAGTEHSHSDIHDLDPFVVDASLSPRSSQDMLTPATVMAADALDLNRAPTIGQMLDGQAGVHSTAFGAGASRPVIRGMEGVRLRVMESGVDTGDLSADSPDHAVAVEPFFVERVEVLRGASTLLYGSSAIGGVVNIIDSRIPRTTLPDGAEYKLMADYQSAAEGWTYAALASVQVEDLVLSFSYLDRDHGDYSIPGHAELEEGHNDEHEDGEHEDEEPFGVLENSFAESQVGSAAASWFVSDKTRLSLAWTGTESLYGVPGHAHGEHEEEEHGEDEESVSIDLSQSTVDFELEHRFEDSWLEAIEGRLRWISYDHQELEGEEVGTDFDRESVEARLVASYLAGESSQGALGLQWLSLDSKAVGEESLTPESETNDLALFFLQEWRAGNLRFEGGARAERREIDVPDDPGYSDWAYSASLGLKVPLGEQGSAGLLFNRAERHPVATELYANGPHAATRQFEIGDPFLGVESAKGIDLSLHYNSDDLSASLTAFYTDFSNYIYAAPTDEEEDELPVYRYTQVDTTFQGFEAELTWHAWHDRGAFFDVGLLMDWVDTDISGSAENLPRIPPYRLGGSVQFGSESWAVSSSLRHSFKQDESAPFEEASASYTNWSASLLMDLPFGKGIWHLIISGENLLDEEIRPNTSPIKDVAPAPGRHLRVNLSLTF
jgi:iron complex outermembrane receptor protein